MPFLVTQSQYEEFRDGSGAMIHKYGEKFFVPVITDWKEYDMTYGNRMLCVYKGI